MATTPKTSLADVRPPSRADSAKASRVTYSAAEVCRNTLSAAMLGGFSVLAAVPASAEVWRLEPVIGVEETATNNVNLEPAGATQSDFVTQITPTLRVSERGAHTRLDGFVSLPMVVYARTGDQNNHVYPSAQLLGNVELVDRFLNVEGAVLITQTYFDAFGPTPLNLTNATDNRYTEQSYRVSPFIHGVTPGNIEYELRNNNIWTNLNGAPISTQNSRLMGWTGRLSNLEPRLGWRAHFDYTDTYFNEQKPIRTQLYRFAPLYNVDPQLRFSASVGYEDNQYALTQSQGAIYGVGLEWHPTDRTNVTAYWEQRFFGSSYLFSFDHRTPLSTWSVRASRNITTYPQQVAGLPAGTEVAGILDGIFAGKYPDPAERQRAIEQFMQDRGLPSVLASPLNLYAEQIVLQELASFSAALIGARNSILFSIYYLHSVPITASGIALPPALSFNNNNTQTGAGMVWTHRLTATALLNLSVTGSRTVENSPGDAKTDQGTVRLVVSSPVSAKTTAYAGARYQVNRTNVGNDYNEAAAFVGLSHSFR